MTHTTMIITVVFVIVIAVLLAGAIVLAVVVASIRREERRMSLMDAPATRVEAAVRRFLGPGGRQAKDNNRHLEAGRR
jgi:hypothetical protein